MTNPFLWISGFEAGIFYSLLALSFYITLIGTNFFNFAIGPLAMLAGLMTSWLHLNNGVDVLLSAGLSIAVVVGVSVVAEHVVVRPVQRRSSNSELPALVAVAGLLFAIQQGAGLIFGRELFPGSEVLNIPDLELFGVVVESWAFALFAIALITFVVLSLWIKRSRDGRLLRAIGDNREAAQIVGLAVNRARTTAFALGGLVAALAGVAFAPFAGVGFDSGLEWTLSGFVAFVIGGLGTPLAPLVGGLLLGVGEVFLSYYFGGATFQWVLAIAALLLLALRPEGIFQRKVRV